MVFRINLLIVNQLCDVIKPIGFISIGLIIPLKWSTSSTPVWARHVNLNDHIFTFNFFRHSLSFMLKIFSDFSQFSLPLRKIKPYSIKPLQDYSPDFGLQWIYPLDPCKSFNGRKSTSLCLKPSFISLITIIDHFCDVFDPVELRTFNCVDYIIEVFD